jgi:protein SCO1/2
MAYAGARPRGWRSLATLLLLALLAAGCAEAADPEAGELLGTSLSNPYQAPDVVLTDTDGAPYALTKDTDKPLTLVFFGFTNCPDICNFVMANLAQSMTRLSDDDRAGVDVVFVTTDPARDDEEALRRYLDQFDDGFEGLTGELDDLMRVGDAFHVFFEKGKRLPTGGYDVAHGTHVFAIDEDDEISVVWNAQTTGKEFATDIHTLLDS